MCAWPKSPHSNGMSEEKRKILFKKQFLCLGLISIINSLICEWCASSLWGFCSNMLGLSSVWSYLVGFTYVLMWGIAHDIGFLMMRALRDPAGNESNPAGHAAALKNHFQGHILNSFWSRLHMECWPFDLLVPWYKTPTHNGRAGHCTDRLIDCKCQNNWKKNHWTSVTLLCVVLHMNY